MSNRTSTDNPIRSSDLRVVSYSKSVLTRTDASGTHKPVNSKAINATKFNFGFCIMRVQPFHIGHERLLEVMQSHCNDCVVIIGSTQESGTLRNPLDFETRKLLINNVFPDIKIIGLKDLGDPPRWAGYVLDFLSPTKPDAYFAGSEEDVNWFKNKVDNLININRDATEHCTISASKIRKMLASADCTWKNYIHSQNHTIIEEKLHGKNLESSYK